MPWPARVRGIHCFCACAKIVINCRVCGARKLVWSVRFFAVTEIRLTRIGIAKSANLLAGKIKNAKSRHPRAVCHKRGLASTCKIVTRIVQQISCKVGCVCIWSLFTRAPYSPHFWESRKFPLACVANVLSKWFDRQDKHRTRDHLSHGGWGIISSTFTSKTPSCDGPTCAL